MALLTTRMKNYHYSSHALYVQRLQGDIVTT